MEDRYYSTGQAATELAVSQAQVRALCQSSAIETEITPGGQWRISKSELDRLKAEGLPALETRRRERKVAGNNGTGCGGVRPLPRTLMLLDFPE